MDDNHYHHSLSIFDSENLKFEPGSSKNQSFNKFPEIFGLADTDTVYDSPA